tara:strand:+ start:2170 stop:3507 length:1338 start_codon:yes stop_codon:yes gene_type:complete
MKPKHTYRTNIALLLIIAFSGSLYGYNIGVMAGVILFMKHAPTITSAQIALFTSAFLWGVASAMLFVGYLADKIGRKKTLALSSIIAIASIFAITFSHSIATFTLARFTIGVACGMIIVATPLYLTEIFPAHLRGRGTVAFQLSLSFGILVSTILSYYFIDVTHWQLLFLYALIPSTLLLAAMLFVPESPRWLHMHNKLAAMKQALLFTHAVKEVDNISSQMLSHPPLHYFALLKLIMKDKRLMLILFITIAIGILNQLTGINAILQYDSAILLMSGLHSHTSAIIGSIVMGGINFVTTIIAIFLIDKFERKKLLRMGIIGIIVCLSLLAAANLLLEPGHIKGMVTLALLVAYVISFAIAPGATIWTLMSEILPSSIRSIGLSIALFLGSIAAALLTLVFLPLVKNVGLSSILLICIISSVIYLITTYFIPNTSGKTLEEIESSL